MALPRSLLLRMRGSTSCRQASATCRTEVGIYPMHTPCMYYAHTMHTPCICHAHARLHDGGGAAYEEQVPQAVGRVNADARGPEAEEPARREQLQRGVERLGYVGLQPGHMGLQPGHIGLQPGHIGSQRLQRGVARLELRRQPRQVLGGEPAEDAAVDVVAGHRLSEVCGQVLLLDEHEHPEGRSLGQHPQQPRSDEVHTLHVADGGVEASEGLEHAAQRL
eukprot:scaffold22109_cov63-Phaeocystis_antarctica.AAC.5